MRKIFVAISFFVFINLCFGSQPEVKKYDSQSDLIEGQIKGVSISCDGELSLAPDVNQVFKSEKPFIWDFVSDSKGNLYVVAGDEAVVFRIDKQGRSKKLYEWKDNEIYALAVDKNDRLYAATSPEGKIYKFDDNFNPVVFAELKIKYIWDMKFDSRNICYAATGDSGAIYSIDKNGKSKVYYHSNETHIRCLAWDMNNQLLAGTYKNGYLYRFDKDGNPFVIYDSDFSEINNICASGNGVIYVSGLSSQTGSAASNNHSTKKSDSQTKSKVSIETISSDIAVASKSGASGILKIMPDGAVKNIWNQTSDQVHSIYLSQASDLYVGTSDKGRLYKISKDDEISILNDLDESQIVVFAGTQSGDIWFATSNLGNIYKINNKFLKNGYFESPVIDADFNSHWGTLKWQENIPDGCSYHWYTRSGNTEKVNSTWSSWVEIAVEEKQGKIKSPEARFLQWKIEFASRKNDFSPRIKNIELSYLQKNLSPEISSIKVESLPKIPSPQIYSAGSGTLPMSSDPSVDFDQTMSMAQMNKRPEFRNGYRKVTWKAEDQNDDQLIFNLYFQPKDEKKWYQLKKNVTQPMHIWDSRMMPDGEYRIKVIGSDERSNPVNMHRTGEKVSDWIVIDNSGPVISDLKINKIKNDSLNITFKVIDNLSAIQKVQFSFNMQKWLWVYPVDWVCDSKKELFDFTLPLPKDDIHAIAIRAYDGADNVGFNRIILKEKND